MDHRKEYLATNDIFKTTYECVPGEADYLKNLQIESLDFWDSAEIDPYNGRKAIPLVHTHCEILKT